MTWETPVDAYTSEHMGWGSVIFEESAGHRAKFEVCRFLCLAEGRADESRRRWVVIWRSSMSSGSARFGGRVVGMRGIINGVVITIFIRGVGVITVGMENSLPLYLTLRWMLIWECRHGFQLPRGYLAERDLSPFAKGLSLGRGNVHGKTFN